MILCSECKVFHEEEYSNHCLRNTSAVKAKDEDTLEGRCELVGHGNGPLKYYCVSSKLECVPPVLWSYIETVHIIN